MLINICKAKHNPLTYGGQGVSPHIRGPGGVPLTLNKITLYIINKPMPGKKLTSKGWAKAAPSMRERTVMKKDCGTKCFLGPVSESCFPICAKKTCKISTKGIYAAYVRAREYGSPKTKRSRTKTKRTKRSSSKIYGHNHTKKLYNSIAARAKKMLQKRGFSKNLK